ncbi:polysaccharide deacetylase family protein [Paenibacillus sp. MMS18-CY102]|uniref:polysaccharide deacetylase family protein n=1 Tax=Paenibacillus sp. MMS18-CY102 TaxID=2682849 RepID=UPI001365D546|nr:polysaccharide deacetylase family protein [Paenibacillus sp. MMS18-CY102]MWC29708.1 ChbG/HpnK family deacetylase [Paenibacillus sp. MMS18-CY102]
MIQKLGFSANDRLLIINADDFGITKGTNDAIIDLFDERAITSTSIMIPCPDSNEAMEKSNQRGIKNIGIHLTLTSDALNPYAPVYDKRTLHSLINADGYFHTDIASLERNADEDDVLLEMEFQIQRAILKGIDPTHLDSHAGSIMGLFTGRDFLEIAFDLCEKYRLPFNLPNKILEQPFFNTDQLRLFQKRIDSANDRKILLIDDIVSLPYCFNPVIAYSKMKKQLAGILTHIKPGITQLTIHPSRITSQLIAMTGCYKERELEHRLLNDRTIKKLINREGIKLISWKDIRDLQRSI